MGLFAGDLLQGQFLLLKLKLHNYYEPEKEESRNEESFMIVLGSYKL
jgi:hypothetical protein